MELAGLCHICNKPAHFNCSSCGGLACKKHVNDEGICESCQHGFVQVDY